MSSDLNLRGLARALHRSYDWTAQNWRRLAQAEGLPRPFIGGEPGGRPWWDGAAVEAWKKRELAPAARSAVTVVIANDPVEIPREPPDLETALLAAAGG